MEEASRGTLSAIAGQLAVIVGVLHLGLGAYYAVGAFGAAVSGDPRVLLWALAGAALVGGVAVEAVGWGRRRLYDLGLAVTATLVAAHVLWPAVVGGAFYLGPAPLVPLSDPLGYLHGLVVGARPVAQVALATELALLAVLLVLLSSGEP